MAVNNTFKTNFDFTTTGVESIKKVFDDLFKLSDSQSLKSRISALGADLTKSLKIMGAKISVGSTDFSKIPFEKIIKDFSRIADQFQRQIDKSGLAEGLMKPIDDEIQKFESSIAKADLKIRELEDNAKKLKEILSKKRTDENAYGVSLGKFKDNKETVDEIEKLENSLKKANLSDERKKKIQEEIEAHKAYLVDYKKFREEEVKINRQIGSQKATKTKAGIRIDELTLERVKAGEQLKPEDLQIKEYEKFKEVLESVLLLKNQISNFQADQEQQKITQTIKDGQKDIEDTDKALKKQTKTLGKKILTGISYYTIFNKVKQLWTTSVRAIQELDKAMTEAAIVTSMNKKEAWALLGAYQELATEVGKTTAEIAGLNAFFLQQGMNVKNALEMTKIAAKSAAIAGISLQESANYLTSAINGFGLAASAAEEVADKFAAVGAATAADFEELAIAMSKVAPVAQSAGVGIDFMMGVLAKGIHTTREAPENIGTAFKTIFARMRELTDIGKATEDGMSLNRVEKALASVGVSLRDTSGQFRDLEDVLMEVGYQWKNLDSLQQAYLATALAGNRQQPRLMAILNDFETTVEFIEISKDSTEAMSIQHMDYMDSMEAASNKLRNAWEQIATTIVKSDLVIGVFNVLSSILNGLGKVIGVVANNTWLLIPALGLLTISLYSTVAAMAATIKTNTAYALSIGKTTFLTNLAAIANKSYILTTLKKTAAQLALAAAMAYSLWVDGMKVKSLKVLAAAAWASLGPYALIAAAIWAVVKAGKALIKAFKASRKSINDYAKDIQKSNKIIYESMEKTTDLQKLVKEYEELQEKVYKTNEEIERQAELLSNLENFTDGDSTISFMSKDAQGEFYLDEQKVRNFLVKEETKQIKEQAKQYKNLAKAINTKGITATLENETMLDAMRDLGQELGEQFIRGIQDAEIQKSVENSMESLIDSLDYTKFFKSSYSDEELSFLAAADGDSKYLYNGINGVYGNLFNKIFSGKGVESLTKGEREEFDRVVKLTSLGSYGSGKFYKKSEKQFNKIREEYKRSQVFDQEYFGQQMSIATKIFEETAKSMTFEQTDLTNEEIITKQLEIYKKSLSDIEKNFSGSARNSIIETLDETYSSLAAIQTLTEQIGGEHAIKFAVSYMDRGRSLADLETFIKSVGLDLDTSNPSYLNYIPIILGGSLDPKFSDIEYTIKDNQRILNQIEKLEEQKNGIKGKALTDSSYAKKGYETDLEDLQRQIDLLDSKIIGDTESLLLKQLFENNRETAQAMLDQDLDAIRTFIPQMYQALIDGGVNAEDAKRKVNEVLEGLFLSSDSIVTNIKNSSDNISKALELNEKLLQGDFSNYKLLLEEYSAAELEEFIKTGDIRTLTQASRDRNIKEIQTSIAATEAKIAAEGENTTLANELSVLKIMLNYYENISDEALVWAYNLEKVSDEIDRLKDLDSAIEDLKTLELDDDSAILAFFEKLRTQQIETSKLAADNNLIDSLETLKEQEQDLINQGLLVNGEIQFTSSVAGLAAIEAYKQSLGYVENSLVNVLELHQREAEIISEKYDEAKEKMEEYYDEQIELIQKYNEEKWTELEYENKLYDLQEKIVAARNKLLGNTVDGSSAATIQQARRELEQLRLDRQKEIEEQMMERVEKELEKQREEELKKLEEARVEATKKLTSATENLANSFDVFTITFKEIINKKIEQEKKPISSSGGSGQRRITELMMVSNLP